MVDYTKSSVFLTGTGEFLPFLSAYLRTPDELTPGGFRDDHLNAGWGTHPGEGAAIVIPLGENPEFAGRLAGGETFFAETKIYHVSDQTHPVKEIPRSELAVTKDTNGSNIILYSLPYGDGVERGGPYLVYMDILDVSGKKVQELQARWLVDDNTARIVNIETSTYTYKKNAPLDITVLLSTYYYADTQAEGTLEVVMRDTEGGEPIVATEAIPLSSDTIDQSISFKDQKMPRGINGVSSITVTLTDPTGSVLDTYTLELKEPVSSGDVENTIVNTVNVLYTLGIIIIILVIGAIVRFMKKGNNDDDNNSDVIGSGGTPPSDKSGIGSGALIGLFIFLTVFSGAFFLDTEDASACSHRRGPNSSPSY